MDTVEASIHFFQFEIKNKPKNKIKFIFQEEDNTWIYIMSAVCVHQVSAYKRDLYTGEYLEHWENVCSEIKDYCIYYQVNIL